MLHCTQYFEISKKCTKESDEQPECCLLMKLLAYLAILLPLPLPLLNLPDLHVMVPPIGNCDCTQFYFKIKTERLCCILVIFNNFALFPKNYTFKLLTLSTLYEWCAYKGNLVRINIKNIDQRMKNHVVKKQCKFPTYTLYWPSCRGQRSACTCRVMQVVTIKD